MLSVSEAVARRRSIRAFLDKAVDEVRVRGVLESAARAPSGGNVQPWLVHVVARERLQALKAFMRERCAEQPGGEPMAYDFYPKEPPAIYATRRWRNGNQLYRALGISREDKAARQAWIDENFQFFGAPLGLLFFMHRQAGRSQWMDLGIYVQTVMLLLQEAGIDSCPQADWALYEASVCRFLHVPDGLTLICGMAVGHADPSAPINAVLTERDSPIIEFPPPPEDPRP